MSLREGDSIGPYKIVGLLGKGGMGEVWRARDEKLQRDVAIKALPAAIDGDENVVARFEREARILASLKHQSIAAVYGLEERDGRTYLVMECVEGETLSVRLARGRMVGHDVLEIARQIAEGLEAAHRSGVIHRDLKPGNVQVDDEGSAKILDFGLARAGNDEVEPSTTAESFFISESLEDTEGARSETHDVSTDPGTLLGTVPYMSPEQARGQRVDHRSDIWSFGCLLYECLTGRRPFSGKTQADLLGAILSEEPSWDLLPEDAPPTIKLLVRRCLAKDRRKRLQDIGDARVELEHAIDDPSSSAFGLSPVARAERRAGIIAALPWVIALAGLLLAVIVWNKGDGGGAKSPSGPSPKPASKKIVKFRIEEPRTSGSSPPMALITALHPDGESLIFVHRDEENDASEFRVRRMDSFEPEPIPGAPSGFVPVYSSDGKELYFGNRTTGELCRMTLPRGVAEGVSDVRFALVSPGDDGSLVYNTLFRKTESGLFRIPEQGAAPEVLTTLADNERDHVGAQVLPGSRRVLFGVRFMSESGNPSELRVLDLDTGKTRTVLRGSHHGEFLPPDILLSQQGNDLLARRVDPKSLELLGDAVVAVRGLATSAEWISVPGFKVSPTGTLLYSTNENPKFTPAWRRRDGAIEPIVAGLEEQRFRGVAPSPDGTRLAAIVTEEDGLDRLCVIDIERGTLRYLTPGLPLCAEPLWSVARPGEIVYTARGPDRGMGIYRVVCDRISEPELLHSSEDSVWASDWSDDGSKVLFDRYGEQGNNADICILHLDESPVRMEEVRVTRNRELQAQLSPNGRWIVFRAFDNGEPHAYLRGFPDAGAEIQLSTKPSNEPIWSKDGDKVLFQDDDGKAIRSVTLDFSDGTPRPSTPEELFELQEYDSRVDWISPDGDKVIIRMYDKQEAPTYWNVVLGFDEELKRLFDEAERASGR